MIAILSDVHANLEALQAVYEDVKARGAKKIFFLGDLIGYGPNPVECVEFIKHFEFCLLGNHDRAVVHGIPNNFNKIAVQAAQWTRKQLDPEMTALKFLRGGTVKRKQESWDFLSGLKPSRVVDKLMCAHDNPLNPGDDKYVRTQEDAKKSFEKHPDIRAFFIGHSHLPKVFTETSSFTPEVGKRYPFNERYIINVGSVGQPRDKDVRACYVTLEPDSFRYYRVPYDYKKTMKKIRAAGLSEKLATRLAEGK